MKRAATLSKTHGAVVSPMRHRLRKNSAKAPNGRRNRLPHHGRSSSCSEVGQAVSPVGSLFPQPVTHGAGRFSVRRGASMRRRAP